MHQQPLDRPVGRRLQATLASEPADNLLVPLLRESRPLMNKYDRHREPPVSNSDYLDSLVLSVTASAPAPPAQTPNPIRPRGGRPRPPRCELVAGRTI